MLPPIPRYRTLARGAIAGLLAGLFVALWFLVADLTAGQPFRTPATLATVVVGGDATPTFGLIVMYSVLHFGIFAVLGAVAASLVHTLRVAPSLLLGALFGVGVLDAVHYGALLLTGTGVLTVLPPLQVIGANLIGGMLMMAYIHHATREAQPLEPVTLGRNPLLVRGALTGLVGAGAVALWFLVLDIVQGRPFHTPAALGSLVFLGASSPADVQVGAAVILAYTVLHVGVFVAVGVLLEWAAERLEHAPGMWLMALLVLITLEGIVLATSASLGDAILGAIGIWAIAVANLLAVAAMGAWLWMRHPRLRHELLGNAIHTRV